MDDLKALVGILKAFFAFLHAPNGLSALIIFVVLAAVVFCLPLGLLSYFFGQGVDRLDRSYQSNTDRIINALERVCPHRVADNTNKREIYE